MDQKILKRSSSFLLATDGSLKQKVVRSSFWAVLLKTITKTIGLIRTIILARILFPSDFGLIGMALITVSLLETFTSSGFEAALIQNRKDIKNYLNTAWTVNVGRAILMAVILFISAPLVAVFFGNILLIPILKVFSLSVLIYGLTNSGIIYFQKELNFKKQFIYELTGIVAEFVTAVSLALIFRNVWALVFGVIAGNTVRAIASFLLHPFKPKLEFNFSKLKRLFGFGKWILGTNIFSYFLMEGDDILVGKLLGSRFLGGYQMAYRLSNLPATQITHVIMQISFPALSQLQNQAKKLKTAYFRFIQLSSFLIFPVSFLIMTLAFDFTYLFLGQKWIFMVPAVYLLSFWAIIRSFSGCGGILFQAVGRPQIESKLQLLRLILMVSLVIPFTIQWGIVGTGLAVGLSGLIVLPLSIGFVASILRCSIWELINIVDQPLLSSIMMVVFIKIFKSLVFTDISLLNFFGLIILALPIYAGSLFLLDGLLGTKLLPQIKNQARKLIN